MLGGSGYLDRMTGRLGDLENEIAALAPTVAAGHEQALRDVGGERRQRAELDAGGLGADQIEGPDRARRGHGGRGGRCRA